ncbi:unnamed protein product, partial [Ectocarpus sp. 12 AP-2014]
ARIGRALEDTSLFRSGTHLDVKPPSHDQQHRRGGVRSLEQRRHRDKTQVYHCLREDKDMCINASVCVRWRGMLPSYLEDFTPLAARALKRGPDERQHDAV